MIFSRNAYQPKHSRADYIPRHKLETSNPSHRAERPKVEYRSPQLLRRIGTITAAFGITLGISSAADGEINMPRPYEDTNVACTPEGFQEIPFNRASRAYDRLIARIGTVSFKGDAKDAPCRDEAITIIREQIEGPFHYDGSVTLPQYLVPENRTLDSIID